MSTATPPVTLHGFNNLAKSLGVSLYTVSAVCPDEFNGYADDINTRYDAVALGELLTTVTRVIGAHVLNLTSQNYDPQGASATVLIAEPETVVPNSLVGHLDKSHMAVHTYPEIRPIDNIAIFRMDIDMTTCGIISPLEALDYVINRFQPDVATIDYRVRGMTRTASGSKRFADHDIDSIQDFLGADIRNRFEMEDINFPQANTFHTRMLSYQESTGKTVPNASKNEYALQSQTASAVQREKFELFQADITRPALA